MEEIQSQVVNIANGLSTLSLVRLPDELFFPRQLLHLFQEIDKKIPEPWNFVIPTHPDNVWLLNQNIKVVTATAINYKSHKSLKLFLHIPIYEKNLRFDTNYVFNIPTIYQFNKPIKCERQPRPMIRKSTRTRRYLNQLRKIFRNNHPRINEMHRYCT